jgi:5-deoxy-glucuronate isomerase
MYSKRLVKPNIRFFARTMMPDLELLASPEQGSSSFLTLYRLDLPAGGEQVIETGDHEHVLDVLSGRFRISGQSRGAARFDLGLLGQRADIFSGPPAMAYVPRQSSYRVDCPEGGGRLVVYSAPTDMDGQAAAASGEAVKTVDAGTSDWSRRVYIAFGEDGPTTRMMVGETHSPPGNWSSFPPHRHQECRPPAELSLEELYYFNFDRKEGFAVGGIYHDPERPAETAELGLYGDGQVFAVPGGYHFISPCPGYRLSYAWALGGPQKGFGCWVDDPRHHWLSSL